MSSLDSHVIIRQGFYQNCRQICWLYRDFLFNLAIKLLKNIDISEYIIKMIEEKQPFYGHIYFFSPIKLEILKIYIKIYWKTGLFNLLILLLIHPSFFIKSLIVASTYTSIIKALIIWPSKIGTPYLWLENV